MQNRQAAQFSPPWNFSSLSFSTFSKMPVSKCKYCLEIRSPSLSLPYLLFSTLRGPRVYSLTFILLVWYSWPINSRWIPRAGVGRWFPRRGCLAKDNNDNNDANALHSHPSSSREAKEVIRRNRRYEGVSERIEGDESEKRVGGGKGCERRWKTCQLSYSSPEFFVLQSARTKKEILFRFHRPSPPPSVFVCSPLAFPLVLSFSFSLIESSNFRLHSPSLPTGENSKDIVSKLGETRIRWRVHSPRCGQRDEREKDGKREREREK